MATAVVTVHEKITAPIWKRLLVNNPGVLLNKLEAKNQIEVPVDTPIDYTAIFSFNEANYELLAKINGHILFEAEESKIIIIQMSTIPDRIAQKVSMQIGALDDAVSPLPPATPVGAYGRDPEFFINATTWYRPDFWWMRYAQWSLANPSANQRLATLPDFVVEVISPSQGNHPLDQRRKCARWVNRGVQFAILIDYINRRTYRYATIASGLIPAGANVATLGGFPLIHEHTITWPGAAPVGMGPHFAPAVICQIPGGTHLATAINGGAPLVINHTRFQVSE